MRTSRQRPLSPPSLFFPRLFTSIGRSRLDASKTMLRIQSGSKSSSPINLRRRKFLRPIVAPSPRAWADDALEKWPSHASFSSRLFPRSFHFSPPPPLFIFRLIVSYSGYGSAYIHTQLLEDAFSREEYIYICTMVARGC